jgi:hypothetical protein
LTALLPDPQQREAIDVLEHSADRTVSIREMTMRVRRALPADDRRGQAGVDNPYYVGLMLYREFASSSTGHHAAHATSGLADGAPEQKQQCRLLRCILGSTAFRAASIDPRWQTYTVVDLANAIYEERAFDRMPILGDALMDAGCDSEEIINHCRVDSPHVRGCWVVDLLLGKE